MAAFDADYRSTSSVDLADLFDEQRDLLRRAGQAISAKQEAEWRAEEEQEDYLEGEKIRLQKELSEIDEKMDDLAKRRAETVSHLEAAEQLMDELLLGEYARNK